MANNMITIPQGFGAAPAVLRTQGTAVNDELGGGITSGFAVLGFRGKVWRVKARGEEKVLTRDDNPNEARGSVEVVIVKASDHLSKIYYEQGFVEGSSAPPDCWSTTGLAPDPASPKRQSATCAGCQHNVWGSKQTPAGKAGKACQDSKRLAVVPVADIQNEVLGGPMLLRTPAASLQDLKKYGSVLSQYGHSYFGVATRISFDMNEAYPKFVFGAIRPLTEDEAQQVLDLRSDERVARILNEAVEVVSSDDGGPQGAPPLFEQPPQPKPPAPAPAMAESTKGPAENQAPAKSAEVVKLTSEVKTPPKPAPAPVEEAAVTSTKSFDDILDGLLG
jgi:hypothetical protein